MHQFYEFLFRQIKNIEHSKGVIRVLIRNRTSVVTETNLE